jgi:hypothetical protein
MADELIMKPKEYAFVGRECFSSWRLFDVCNHRSIKKFETSKEACHLAEKIYTRKWKVDMGP